MRDLATLTVDDFTETVGTRYALDGGPEGPLELELLRADALDGAPAGAPRQPFSLIFAGPVAPGLSQGVHLLRNAALGELEIFLVPIAPEADGGRYEAVFA